VSGINPLDYLLGELGPDEMAAGRRLEGGDPAFRAEVERLRPVVVALEALPEEAWNLPTPPAFSSLGITDEPTVAAARPKRRWWPAFPTLQPAVGLAAAAALLVIGGIGGALIAGGGSSSPAAPDGRTVVLASLATSANPASGDAKIIGNSREIALDLSDLPENHGGSYYGVWLLNTDGTMVSLGGVHIGMDGHAVLDAPIPVDASKYEFVDVSLEPGDGNPRHSGNSVLRGRIS
jgi:anti-sigma-K factor RskA